MSGLISRVFRPLTNAISKTHLPAMRPGGLAQQPLDTFERAAVKYSSSRVEQSEKGLSVMKIHPESTVKINNAEIIHCGEHAVESGAVLQLENTLYKVRPDNKLFKVSDDAQLVQELFLGGVHDVHFAQGQMGNCVKLTQLKALLDDPTGQGLRDLLKVFERDGQGGYLVRYADGRRFHFSRENLEFENGWATRLKSHAGDKRGVQGPLAIQMLERAHYLGIAERKSLRLKPGNLTRNAPAKRLADNESVLRKDVENRDHQWGDDYLEKLLGKGSWKQHSFDGADRAFGDTTEVRKRAWYNKKKTFHERATASKASRDKIFAHFDEIERNPSKYRYSTGTRSVKGGDDTIRIRLSNGQSLYANHAYYLKGIIRDSRNQRRFILENPHNTVRTMNLSQADFMENFAMFNGVHYVPAKGSMDEAITALDMPMPAIKPKITPPPPLIRVKPSSVLAPAPLDTQSAAALSKTKESIPSPPEPVNDLTRQTKPHPVASNASKKNKPDSWFNTFWPWLTGAGIVSTLIAFWPFHKNQKSQDMRSY